jgi:hypothetical protein
LAAYVLPRFDNKPYRLLEKGDCFGHIDFAIQEEMIDFDLSKTKRLKRKNIVRRFTTLGMENCELLILNMDELEKMRLEFPDQFILLFEGANQRLQKELILKLEIIKKEDEKNPLYKEKQRMHGVTLPPMKSNATTIGKAKSTTIEENEGGSTTSPGGDKTKPEFKQSRTDIPIKKNEPLIAPS